MNASSSLMRRLGGSALIALLVSIVPMRLDAQTGTSSAFMPSNAIGQVSIGGGAPVPIYAIGFDVRSAALGGGGGAGQPQVSDISVEKQPDALSTSLFRSTLQGIHLPTVRIELYRPGGTALGSTIQLTDVLVTSFRGTERQGESVAFNASQILFSTGGQSFCWDVRLNASC